MSKTENECDTDLDEGYLNAAVNFIDFYKNILCEIFCYIH